MAVHLGCFFNALIFWFLTGGLILTSDKWQGGLPIERDDEDVYLLLLYQNRHWLRFRI